MGTPDQNKALVRHFIDALTRGDVAGAAECFDSERYYSHAHQADLAGTWQRMKDRHRTPAFSDFASQTIALVAEGDRVVHHSRMSGTHTGEFLGITATGKRITMDHVELWRITDDKIVEHWGGTWEVERVLDELRRGDA